MKKSRTTNNEKVCATKNYDKKIHRIVLTGGPCGGKTTGQVAISNFFENLGWKVYRVPEAATILKAGGVKGSDFNENNVRCFQYNLIYLMMRLENTYIEMAQHEKSNVLIICDRGILDATVYMPSHMWTEYLDKNNLTDIDVRDNRYDHICHMVSAADGAENFYNDNNNSARHETIQEARTLDSQTLQAWIGHPYIDVIDNSTNFAHKKMRLIKAICERMGIDTSDRLVQNSKKRKFLIESLPNIADFPETTQIFNVIHHYLLSNDSNVQSRIRKRGINDSWSYLYTARIKGSHDQNPELKRQISYREYKALNLQADPNRYPIFKRRHCFMWNKTYYQLDVYKEPCHKRCMNLIFLETFTSKTDELQLPDFIKINKEITGVNEYSMYNLSLIKEK
ncbi:hypothetical protein A3Q56_00781 [Intoshia linei]|uniref:NadR/Ttd14 AAA domain-containing protein n=1 Tax=Intoshia linei TaxID=1819745 RepID=A0A177BB58_9BILA|nr:hypothetical protein A3Q56_00781 [Intoshia linei]